MMKKTAWIVSGLIALYAAAGFWLLPYLLRTLSSAYIGTYTEGALAIRKVRFNPFTFVLRAENIKLEDPFGMTLFGVGSVVLDIDLDALFAKKIRLKNSALTELQVNLAHFRDMHWNHEWLADPAQGTEGKGKTPETAYHYQFRAAKVMLDEAAADLGMREMALGNLTVASPVVHISRSRPFPAGAAAKASPAGETAEPWQLDVGHVGIDNGTVRFQDFVIAGAPYLALDALQIGVDGLSSRPRSTLTYNVSTQINETGRIRSTGSVGLMPVTYRGSIALEHLPLAPVNPYLQRETHMALQGGSLTLQQKITYTFSQKQPDLLAEGSAAMEGVTLLDTRSGSRLVAFDRIGTGALRLELLPGRLEIEDMAVEGLYADAVVSESRTFNFAGLVKERPAGTAAKPGPAEKEKTGHDVFPVNIGKLSVSGGSADFADYSIPLRFRTHIDKLEGSVLNLSSAPEGIATVDIRGVVDTLGTAKLQGSVESAAPKHFTDLRLGFRNLDLTAYTPYTAKFVGRKIARGRFSLDLNYKIADSRLQGANSVVINRIKLGERVESPGAADLPLDLAIALLEDSKGMIDMDLPVKGNLADPEFKVGPTVRKAVFNLLKNVVTAPFKLLGSLLGIKGERLEYVEFEPGSAVLLPAELEKLDLLGKALKKRPGLALKVGSRYDVTSDIKALKEAKAAALIFEKGGGKPGQDVREVATVGLLESLNAAHMTPEALETLRDELRRAHKDDGLFESMYREALMRQLAEAQSVERKVLKALALHRSEAVGNYLTGSYGIAAERITRTEPRPLKKRGSGWIRVTLGVEAIKTTKE
jgi:hypothetical protein